MALRLPASHASCIQSVWCVSVCMQIFCGELKISRIFAYVVNFLFHLQIIIKWINKNDYSLKNYEYHVDLSNITSPVFYQTREKMKKTTAVAATSNNNNSNLELSNMFYFSYFFLWWIVWWDECRQDKKNIYTPLHRESFIIRIWLGAFLENMRAVAFSFRWNFKRFSVGKFLFSAIGLSLFVCVSMAKDLFFSGSLLYLVCRSVCIAYNLCLFIWISSDSPHDNESLAGRYICAWISVACSSNCSTSLNLNRFK